MTNTADLEKASVDLAEATQPSVLALKQIGRTQLALTLAYLHGSRHFLDLWRTAIREQQDRILAEWHSRLWAPASTVATASAPARSETRPVQQGNSKRAPETPKDVIRSKRRTGVDRTETFLLSREH